MAKIYAKFSRPPGTRAATFKVAVTEALRAMLVHWHETYVPGHFETSANAKYGYQPRQGDNEPPRIPRAGVDPRTGRADIRMIDNPHYSWIKRRKKGHNKPLVWSGESKAIATDLMHFDVQTLSAGRVRGRFTGLPSYWYKYWKRDAIVKRRRADGSIEVVSVQAQPNKAAELTRITNAELQDMMAHGRVRLVSALQRLSAPMVASSAA